MAKLRAADIGGNERFQKFVPMHGQRLGEEICHVDGARDVPHDELTLGHTVLKPV